MLFVGNVNHEKRTKIKKNGLKGLKLLQVNRSKIPAVTHVDYSARIQTVDSKFNKKFFQLLSEFYKKTKCPVLINTSFNVRGEPIVCSPKDAIECFMSTNLDALVIENFFILKDKQDEKLKNLYIREFDPD